MGPSRTDAPHAARRDEPAARAVLLHQHRFTCDPAGLHVVACSTSVTCSTFLLLQHFRHLQHFSSLAAHPSLAARLHLRPADLARLARRPAPLTSPAVLRVLPAVLRLQHLRPTDQRLLHLHGTCFLSFPRHLLSARAHSGTCKHGAARHNPLLRMRLPLRPAPDAPRPLHLRHRGLVSAAVLHAERWRGRAGGGRRYVCMLDEPASER